MEKELILNVVRELASKLTRSNAHQDDDVVIDVTSELWDLASSIALDLKYSKK